MYFQPEDVPDYTGDINELGYNPGTYAASAGYELAGSANETAFFEFSQPAKHLLIHSPEGSSVRLDSITFYNEKKEAIAWVAYNYEARHAGYTVASGLVSNYYMTEGVPDGFYSLLGRTDETMAYYHTKCIVLERYGSETDVNYLSVPSSFSAVTIHIASDFQYDPLFSSTNNLSPQDLTSLNSIFNDLTKGYATENSAFILQHYLAEDQAQIGRELDIIFESFDIETFISNVTFSGNLPFANIAADPSNYTIYLKANGSNNIISMYDYYSLQNIVFRKVNDEWFIVYDNGGIHFNALRTLSLMNKYVFPTPLIIPPGDINGNELLELSDAIWGLQILSGVTTEGVELTADTNDNNKIDFSDIFYVLNNI